MTTSLNLPLQPAFKKSPDLAYEKIPERHAIGYVAATIVLLSYAGWFGAYPILLFFAIWLPRTYYKGKFTLLPTPDWYPLIALQALLLASTLWSDYWWVTAKSALESAAMIMCTMIIARVTTMESFLKGITLGVLVALVASLLNGNYGRDYFTGVYSLIGFFGSKNQVGFCAEIGIFAALLLLLSPSRKLDKIFYSLLPLVICAISLYLGRSATAMVTLAVTLVVCLIAYLLARLPGQSRVPAVIASLFFAIVLVLTAFYFEWLDVGLTLLGKDATLTGRTHLWDAGIDFGLQRPFLGGGFYAFWVEGQPLAETLWAEFDIIGRTGFHFHNVFVQSFVDLGFAGLLLISWILVLSCIKSFRFVMQNGSGLVAYYALGMSVMFLTRSFVEVDIWTTFHAAAIMFYSVLPRLAMEQPVKIDHAAVTRESLQKLFYNPAQSAERKT